MEVVANRSHIDRGEGVERGGGGRDGRDRCWVRRPEADAEDLDAGGTNRRRLSVGPRVAESVRQQE